MNTLHKSMVLLLPRQLFYGIRGKALAGILGIVLLMALVGAISTQVIRDNAETFARKNAESAALVQAQALAREESNPPTPSLFSQPALLQDYVVEHVHMVERQDIVVVDKSRRILADVIQTNVETIYHHDTGNEVSKTLADGMPRTFVEASNDYPQGIRQIVAPIKSDRDGSIVGALILEYSSTYRDAMSIASNVTNTFLIFNLIGGVLGSLLVYFILRSIANPVQKLNQATLRIAQGDWATAIEIPRGNELEAFAKTFDGMRTSVAATLEKLQVEIAERQRAEQALRESEAQYHQLVESVPEIIYAGTFGTEPTVSPLTFVSRQVERILGYTTDEFLNHPDIWFTNLHPDDVAQVTAATLKVYAGQATIRRYRIRKRDSQEYCWLEDRIVPQWGTDDHVIGYFGVARDITEQVQADQVLAQDTREMTALYETTHDLAAEHDLPSLLQVLVDRATTMLAAPSGGIYLYDVARGDLELSVTKNCPIQIGTRLAAGEGMAGQILLTKQPLIIHDYQTWEHRSSQFNGMPFSAVVEVPMLYGGELIGVLFITEIDDIASAGQAAPRGFTEADARLLSLFASQAAAAVHNTRLFQEAHRRAAEMQALREIGLDLASQLETEPLLEAIVRRATDLLGSTGGIIYQWEESTQQLRCVVSYHLSRDYSNVTLMPGEGMAGRVYQTRQPLIVNDYARWEGRAPQLRNIPSRAVISVPILWHDRVIGVININDESNARAFDDQDVRLLSLFAHQAAIAMENARLFEETRRRVEQLAVLNRIADAMSRALRLDELVEVIYREITASLAADAFFIALYDRAAEELIYPIRVDQDIHEPMVRRPFAPGLTAHVITSAKPLLIRDWEQEKSRFPSPRVWGTMKLPRAWLGVPLLIGGMVGGVISVQAYYPNAYDEEDEKWLVTVADQVAIAIEKMRLFEETRRHTREQGLVNEMAQMLQTCQRFEEAYSVIEHFASQLFPTPSGALYLLSASRNYLDRVAGWGESAPSEQTFAPDECWALRRGRIYAMQNPRSGTVCQHVVAGGRSSVPYLCVPLLAQGDVLGLLHLQSKDDSPSLSALDESLTQLTEVKRQFIGMVAEQIALALSNLRLRETLREQSIRDPLTGLFNRRYLEETLEREIHRAKHSRASMGVIMLDLDHFKRFNDTYGHETGNAALGELGKLLLKHVRGSDIACRYGGEEFTLILPEATLEITRQRAEQLRQAAKGLSVQHRRSMVGGPSLSLGVAVYPEHGATAVAVLDAADAALYRAKRAGRDQVQVASSPLATPLASPAA